MNRKIIDNFFINQATRDETNWVLEWFDTADGRQYLQRRLDMDSGLMDRKELKDLVTDLNSEKLYRSIQTNIKKRRNVFSRYRRDWFGYTMKFVVAVIVIITGSLFSLSHQHFVPEQAVEKQLVIFQTGDEENRNIELGDGTEIRLNRNSKIIISKDFNNGTREVALTGEALFDEKHNPEQPFIIHTNQSSLGILGTAFNVRSIEEQGYVQVAVVNGHISFNSEEYRSGSEHLSAILSKNQYGYQDLGNRSMNVDDLGIENYHDRKSGRFIFEDLTMQ